MTTPTIPSRKGAQWVLAVPDDAAKTSQLVTLCEFLNDYPGGRITAVDEPFHCKARGTYEIPLMPDVWFTTARIIVDNIPGFKDLGATIERGIK